MKGTKHDNQKPRMQLLPMGSLERVAEVMSFGAEKYGDDNWKDLEDGMARYSGAMLRHYAAHQRGETLDPESGLPHLAHLATNALFMLHFFDNPQKQQSDE